MASARVCATLLLSGGRSGRRRLALELAQAANGWAHVQDGWGLFLSARANCGAKRWFGMPDSAAPYRRANTVPPQRR